MNTLLVSSTLLAGHALVLIAQGRGETTKLSVCELLVRATAFDGKIVTVRGLDIFTIHSRSLGAFECQWPDNWRAQVRLELGIDKQANETPEYDQQMNEIVSRFKRGYRGRIVSTFTGRFVSRPRLGDNSNLKYILLLGKHVATEFPD